MTGVNRYIGSPVRRVEDRRFLRGRGEYVADLTREGLLHAAILRSPVAHGRIRVIDPQAALDKYLAQKDALHAGRQPRADPDALTVKQLANEFLIAKQALVDNGELSPRTWAGYKLACDELVAQFGKGRLVSDLGPDDFAALRNKLAKRYGPHGLGTHIQCVRCVCKYAYDASLIDRPLRYGPGFTSQFHFKMSSRIYSLPRTFLYSLRATLALF